MRGIHYFLRLGIFSLMPFGMMAFEGETDPEREIKPWFTGPILATSGNIVPAGHVNVQPYFFGFARTAFYNNNWVVRPIETLWNLQFKTPFWIGLSPWADLRIAPIWMWNYRNHQSQWVLGDWSAQIDLQLLKDVDRNWTPAIKIGIRETFPTGKYQKFNPQKFGTDGGGRGTYETMFSLNASKIFHLGGFHFLSLRLNLSYSLPTDVHVKGYNNYGGGMNTNGTVSPENFFFAIFAFEYAFTRNWAICCDFQCVSASKVTFEGYEGIVPRKDSQFSPIGVPASNEIQASVQYSAAPGIEYNWSENLGLLAGVWLTFAGKNSSRFTTGVLSLNYYH